MNFESWYNVNRHKIPQFFVENVSLIDVLKTSDPLTEHVLKGYDEQSSHILKKIDQLDNEYQEAYKEMMNTESKTYSSNTVCPRIKSITSFSRDDAATVKPPEIVYCPQSEIVIGFDWGTVQTRDILQPSLIQKYWDSTGRCRNTWLDFSSWIADGNCRRLGRS